MELTNSGTVLLAEGATVPYPETVVQGSPCITHRGNSGSVILRGVTNQCRARYLASYSGNISVPATGTAGEISLAIAVDGEPLESKQMRVTPTATGAYFNVSASAYIDVPKGTSARVSVENTSSQAINVANSTLIVTREA